MNLKGSIWMIRETDETSRFLFMELDYAEENGGFDSSRYEKVYEFDIPITNHIKGALEYIYWMFNAQGERPYDYLGRSISISDVVVIDSPTFESGAFYCDRIGWKPLKDAWKQGEISDGCSEA